MEVEDREHPALVVTQDPPEQPEVVESQVQVEQQVLRELLDLQVVKEHPDQQDPQAQPEAAEAEVALVVAHSSGRRKLVRVLQDICQRLILTMTQPFFHLPS